MTATYKLHNFLRTAFARAAAEGRSGWPRPTLMTRKELLGAAILLGAGTIGGAVFFLMNFPAAWLTGAMLVASILALSKVPLFLPSPFRFIVFLVLGNQIGSGFTPDMLERVMKWPLSLVGLALTMLLVIGASATFLVNLGKWSRPTAFYASVPGALSYVLALSMRTSADMRLVMMAQMLRLVLLLAVLPSLLTLSMAPPHIPVREFGGLYDVLLEIGFGGALALVLERRGVPAGALFGGMLASSALHFLDLVHGQTPQAILIPCQLVLGALIGMRFADTDIAFMKRAIAPSLGAFVIAVVLCTGAALLVAWGLHLPPGQVVVAFAPGGIEAMTLLAVVLGLDPAFVATHQLVRFFGLALTLPLITRLYLRDQA